jgi:hypothetical protein
MAHGVDLPLDSNAKAVIAVKLTINSNAKEIVGVNLTIAREWRS